MSIQNFIVGIESNLDGVQSGSLKPSTVFTKLPQWDSIALLNVLAMIDADYGVQLSGEDVRACGDIEALYALVLSAKKK